MPSQREQEPIRAAPSGGKCSTAAIDELRDRRTCSIDEASRLLGIGRSTAYAAAHDGSLPTLRVSHRLLVPTAKLLAMLGIERHS
jgi:excisionase family DNA binding protein